MRGSPVTDFEQKTPSKLPWEEIDANARGLVTATGIATVTATGIVTAKGTVPAKGTVTAIGTMTATATETETGTGILTVKGTVTVTETGTGVYPANFTSPASAGKVAVLASVWEKTAMTQLLGKRQPRSGWGVCRRRSCCSLPAARATASPADHPTRRVPPTPPYILHSLALTYMCPGLQLNSIGATSPGSTGSRRRHSSPYSSCGRSRDVQIRAAEAKAGSMEGTGGCNSTYRAACTFCCGWRKCQ